MSRRLTLLECFPEVERDHRDPRTLEATGTQGRDREDRRDGLSEKDRTPDCLGRRRLCARRHVQRGLTSVSHPSSLKNGGAKEFNL